MNKKFYYLLFSAAILTTSIGLSISVNATDNDKSNDIKQIKNQPKILEMHQQVGPGFYDYSINNATNLYTNTDLFLSQIKSGAIQGWKQYKILPSITAAQAILESGWGKSQLAIQANNLFGIKGSYLGNYITMPTKEYINGKWIVVQSNFRKYPSHHESMVDHGEFLQQPRYQNLIGKTDHEEVARLLKEDGYATDPNYSNLLLTLINQYDLRKWDIDTIGSWIEQKHHVETGDFLGEDTVKEALVKMKSIGVNGRYVKTNRPGIPYYHVETGGFSNKNDAENLAASYKNDTQNNASVTETGRYQYPFYYIESTKPFSKSEANKMVEEFSSQTGYWATRDVNSNNIKKYEINTGVFIGKKNVEKALTEFKNVTGFWGRVVHLDKERYYINSSTYSGEESVLRAYNYFKAKGYWSSYKVIGEETGYKLVTGNFGDTNSLKQAESYMNTKGWSNKTVNNKNKKMPTYKVVTADVIDKQMSDTEKKYFINKKYWAESYQSANQRYFYHIVTENYENKVTAQEIANQLTNKFGWWVEIKK